MYFMSLQKSAKICKLMKYIKLIDSCQAHMPVHYISNIKFLVYTICQTKDQILAFQTVRLKGQNLIFCLAYSIQT